MGNDAGNTLPEVMRALKNTVAAVLWSKPVSQQLPTKKRDGSVVMMDI